MLQNIIDTLKENPALAIGGTIGALAGALGGVYFGSSTLSSILLGGTLGIIGLAGGIAGGHYISRQMDRNTPAPMGMRQLDSPKAEPGKPAAIELKPSVAFSDTAMNELETSLRANPDFDSKYGRYMPLLKSALPYSKVILQGTASADGKTMDITSATIRAPGIDDVTFTVTGISMPMKDGKIDQDNPEAKTQMKAILRQGIQKMLPADLQKGASDSLDKTLGTTTKAPRVPDERSSNDTLADALLKGATVTSGFTTASLPMAKTSSERAV